MGTKDHLKLLDSEMSHVARNIPSHQKVYLSTAGQRPDLTHPPRSHFGPSPPLKFPPSLPGSEPDYSCPCSLPMKPPELREIRS